MPECRKLTVVVDASLFQKDVGDLVSAGQTLGTLDGEPVVAPFNAQIESVWFDSDGHLLHVVLVERVGI
jgi:hypothetical protein